MKKIILFILISLILISFAFAGYSREIIETSKSLKMENDLATIYFIDDWVETNINYKFYWYSRFISQTWDEKEGDCTDKAILKKQMANVHRIETRLVHGYADEVLHDWIEYKINGDWINLETTSNLEKKGAGIW